jgi:hypothetical protein
MQVFPVCLLATSVLPYLLYNKAGVFDFPHGLQLGVCLVVFSCLFPNFDFIVCYGLNLECPSKVHLSKAESPA